MAIPSGQSVKMLKFGFIRGQRQMVGPVGLSASLELSDLGGKFVQIDGSGQLDDIAAGDGTIFGWAELSGRTATANSKTYSSVAGADSATVDVSTSSVYCIPVNPSAVASLAVTMINNCIYITKDATTNAQYADIDTAAAGNGQLMIVDVDLTNNMVYVKINPTVQNETDLP